MEIDEKIDKILQGYLFSTGLGWENLPKSDLDSLMDSSQILQLKKKQILFKEGSFPNGVYIVKSGRIKIYKTNPDGSVHILFIYSPGEFFGYRPIIANTYWVIGAAALENCEILFIDRQVFSNTLKQSLALSNMILENSCKDFGVVVNRINLFAQKSLQQRLSLALLLLNKKYTIGGGNGAIKLSRTDLASYVGTSLESLIRTLHLFKSKKLIDFKDRCIVIANADGLFKMADI